MELLALCVEEEDECLMELDVLGLCVDVVTLTVEDVLWDEVEAFELVTGLYDVGMCFVEVVAL